MIRPFSPEQVTLSDAYLCNAFEKELAYLKSYNPDRLLACFRTNAGLTGKDKSYPGWENTEIKGHTLGHYLKALSQAYLNRKEKAIMERLRYMIDELALCQRDDGFLFASPEDIFSRVEERKPAWVPWYTMHKILAGLTFTHEATGYEKALETASRLGDWISCRTGSWTDEVHGRVLSIEYGGMNDALYDLFRLTGKEDHLRAARAFDELSLWEPIRKGEDILRGKHANTTIPKILGALNRYALTGDGEALETAVRFWDMVTDHHSYITGGNSEWEHFGEPDILDRDRSRYTCETCNTYNMLKLTRGLFMATGESRYADFYERTYINAILSSQNPESGMTMYFQPMAVGYFKVYGSPFDHFWCCTGTGMESFSKLNDSLYFREGDTLYVNMYYSSRLDWRERGLKLEVKADLTISDRVSLTVEEALKPDEENRICLRIPPWIRGEAEAKLNGAPLPCRNGKGYIRLRRRWQSGDVLELRLPRGISVHTLPDNRRAAAFQYGPFVLSAALGREDLSLSQTGVMVDVPTKNMIIKDFLTLTEGTPEEWLSRAEENIVREGERLEFRLKNVAESDALLFTPHFLQHRERYGLYWHIAEKDSEEIQNHLRNRKDEALLAESTVDSLPVGNDQYELTHGIKGEKTYAGTWDGYNYRCADKGGWFRYDMKVIPGGDTLLMIRYFDFDRNRPVIIEVDGELIIREECDFPRRREFRDRLYTIPASLTKGKSSVTVTFRAEEDNKSAGIYHILRTLKPPSSDARLSGLSVKGAALSEPFSPGKREYSLTGMQKDIPLSFALTPAAPNGLVFINGMLIDETEEREIPDKTQDLAITVIGEDRKTEITYTLRPSI